MACKCGIGSKTRNDIENVWERVGSNEFKWRDVKDVMEQTPQFYANLNILKVVRMEGSFKVYKLADAYIPKSEKRYKIKKVPLYPKKTFTGGEIKC